MEDADALAEDKGGHADEHAEPKPLLLFGTQQEDTTSLKKPKTPQPKKKTKLELLLFI